MTCVHLRRRHFVIDCTLERLAGGAVAVTAPADGPPARAAAGWAELIVSRRVPQLDVVSRSRSYPPPPLPSLARRLSSGSHLGGLHTRGAASSADVFVDLLQKEMTEH